MRVFAFQGTRYTSAAGADPGKLAAPPYDQITDAARDRYHAGAPHHFAQLTRPNPGPEGDPYRHAAALHRQWLERGVIAKDERPALYPYVIELEGGGRRLGLAALVGFEDSRAIRPHELTLDQPLADRRALLTATEVDLEPVLLLPEDAGELDRLLADDLAWLAPIFVHTDSAGHNHVLYRLDDPERIAVYRQALAQVPAAIADGHHRYEVGQRHAEAIGAHPGTAAAAKLAVLTSLNAAHLTIDPIHRALAGEIDLRVLHPFAVERHPWQGSSGVAFAAAVAAAPQPALGVWPAPGTPGVATPGTPEIWRLDPSAAASTAPGAARLPVVLLHDLLFPALGLPAAAGTDGTVIYRSDPAELHRMVAAGEVAVGFFLPPMTPADFAAAIAHGDVLPPKSTRFLPKVFSGLVWATHDAGLA
jgi:uncharacterized protein (DUF1015 family)